MKFFYKLCNFFLFILFSIFFLSVTSKCNIKIVNLLIGYFSIVLFFFFLVTLLSLIAPFYGYFENCDFRVRLRANEGTTVINPGGFLNLFNYFRYVGYFAPRSSCRYYFEVPVNYVVNVHCDIDIAITVCVFIVIKRK